MMSFLKGLLPRHDEWHVGPYRDVGRLRVRTHTCREFIFWFCINEFSWDQAEKFDEWDGRGWKERVRVRGKQGG